MAKCVKKRAAKSDDRMRAEYRREDLGPIVRGKYAARHAKPTNVVVIDAALTKAFPNAEGVNDALRGLLALAPTSARPTSGTKRTPRQCAAA